MRLDDEIRLIHERYWETELQSALNKSVILVEGDDDLSVLSAMLTRRRRTWTTRIRVIAAGGRKQVFKARSRFKDPFLLVDRDTWTDDEIESHRREVPGLYVTSGWCLENLFLDPEFLADFDSRVRDDLERVRDLWLRAGALWWTLQRAREAQQATWEQIGWTAYGAPRADRNPSSAREFLDLVGTPGGYDFEALAHQFEARLQAVQSLDLRDQWRLGVHGKSAFAKLLEPSLRQHHERRDWRVALTERLGRPSPLDEVMALLLV